MDQSRATATDGRIRRGDETRRAVLRRAVDVASVEGLDGVTIGRLAQELSISKSGLFAHFGSKEELQLATIRAARAIFSPGRRHPGPGEAGRDGPAARPARGVARLLTRPGVPRRLLLLPGDPRVRRAAGPVRDALAEADQEWLALVAATIDEARELGEVRADVDPRQLAYELDAYLDSANMRSLLGGDPAVYDLARAAVDERLDSVADRLC